MATITRAQAEVEMISRLGKKMTFANLDGATVDGTNTDLSGAFAVALRGLGITPSNPFTVTDSDLSGVGSDDLEQFMDRAELRVWENILGNLDTVDIKTSTRSHSYSQIASQAEKAIERLEAKMQSKYGDGVGALEAGVIELDFQARTDDEITEE